MTTNRLVSLGIKHRKPSSLKKTAVQVEIDCTRLPNPHFDMTLRQKDGRDMFVRQFVRKGVNYSRTLQQVVDAYMAGNEVVCFCIGGKHRSVALVEDAALLLRGQGYEPVIKHMEL